MAFNTREENAADLAFEERTLTCTEGCIPHQDAHTEECIKTDEQYQAEAWADIDAQSEPLNDACERLNDPPLQGVCKDCGNGTLNNTLNPAFADGDDGFVCLMCNGMHLDIL